jgi:hypothetical protein
MGCREGGHVMAKPKKLSRKAAVAAREEVERRARELAGRITPAQRRAILDVYSDGQGQGCFDWDERHPDPDCYCEDVDRDTAGNDCGVNAARDYLFEAKIADEENSVVSWLITLIG